MRVAALLTLAIALAPASGASSVPLMAALAKTYRENPSLESARAELRAIDEGVPLALSGARPRITVSSEMIYDRVDTRDGTTDLQTASGGMRFEQPVYTGGRVTTETSLADARVHAARARLASIEQDVLLAAVKAFVGVRHAQQVLELSHANEGRALHRLESVRQRFRFGDLTSTDVAQAEARLARALADRRSFEGQLRVAGSSYQRVIGDPPGSLGAAQLPVALPATLDEALAMTEEHPEIKSASLDVDVAKLEIEVADTSLKPHLTLRAEAGYVNEPSTDIAWQRDLKFGAFFEVPLYQGGGAYARMRKARQLHGARGHDLTAARRAAHREVSASWELLQSVEAQLISLEARRRATSIALDGVREEARIGARSIMDVLDAEQQMFDAELALENARRDKIVSGFRLLAAIGSLTADAISLDVGLYDPAQYYRETRTRWFGTNVATDDEH